VLQEREFERLGGLRPLKLDIRLIAATNKKLSEAVEKGDFRKDLYYRLRTHHVSLPPLRERPGDLPLLVHHFVEKAAQALGKPAPAVPRAVFQLLKTYRFPGNVRELEALVFDAVARHQGATLSLHSFKEATAGASPLPESQPQADGSGGALAALFPDPLPTLRETEEALVAEALRRADGNQGVAAGLLGISRQALNKRLSRRKPAAPAMDLDPYGQCHPSQG